MSSSENPEDETKVSTPSAQAEAAAAFYGAAAFEWKERALKEKAT